MGFNLKEADAVGTIFAWLACQPEYSHREPPTDQKLVEAFAVLADSAAKRYDGAGVDGEQMRELFTRIVLDRRYGYRTDRHRPTICGESLGEAMDNAAGHADDPSLRYVWQNTIEGAVGVVPQSLVDQQRAADAVREEGGED